LVIIVPIHFAILHQLIVNSVEQRRQLSLDGILDGFIILMLFLGFRAFAF